MRPPASTNDRPWRMVGRRLMAVSSASRLRCSKKMLSTKTRSAPGVRPGYGREGAVKRVGTARLHAVQLDAQPLGRHVRHP